MSQRLDPQRWASRLLKQELAGGARYGDHKERGEESYRDWKVEVPGAALLPLLRFRAALLKYYTNVK